MLLDIGRWAALDGDVVGNLRGRNHVNGVPGAPALTQRAADAALQVNIAEAAKAGHIHPGNLVDAIDGADFDTCVAAGAIVRPDDRQFLRKLLARFARTLSHGT